MPSRRCMDCPLDATHTLTWRAADRFWYARSTDNQAALHLYCRWHATVRAVQRLARGVLPPMQQLRKLLARPACEEDGEMPKRRAASTAYKRLLHRQRGYRT